MCLNFIFDIFIPIGEPCRPESKHPTALIRRSVIYLLRTLSICASIHAENSQKEAVNNLCGLIHTIVYQTVHTNTGEYRLLSTKQEKFVYKFCFPS